MILTPYKKAEALNPKGKAFLIICTYGTVGGALLGFATMAFGTNSRAIAQGASLGLYAGIAFGSYVITSHKKPGEELLPPEPGYGPPPGGAPPMTPPAGGFDEGSGFGAPVDDFGDQGGGGFFGTPQRYIEINNDLMYNYRLKNEKGRDFSLPIYINLINTTF